MLDVIRQGRAQRLTWARHVRLHLVRHVDRLRGEYYLMDSRLVDLVATANGRVAHVLDLRPLLLIFVG